MVSHDLKPPSCSFMMNQWLLRHSTDLDSAQELGQKREG